VRIAHRERPRNIAKKAVRDSNFLAAYNFAATLYSKIPLVVTAVTARSVSLCP